VLALRSVLVLLGGFAGARVYGYALDGVDAQHELMLHQHAVFCAEVLGSSVAALLLAATKNGDDGQTGRPARRSQKRA
jgi:hypothetical protein